MTLARALAAARTSACLTCEQAWTRSDHATALVPRSGIVDRGLMTSRKGTRIRHDPGKVAPTTVSTGTTESCVRLYADMRANAKKERKFVKCMARRSTVWYDVTEASKQARKVRCTYAYRGVRSVEAKNPIATPAHQTVGGGGPASWQAGSRTCKQTRYTTGSNKRGVHRDTCMTPERKKERATLSASGRLQSARCRAQRTTPVLYVGDDP
jgi:hypothetical protein